MQHQVEAREPFLDPAVVRHALALDGAALVRERGGLAVGKAPLRDLYDLYPSELPAVIRDRTKVPFSEGAGLDVSPQDSAWKMRFEDAISDLDLLEGRAEYAAFGIQTKEELFYLRSLARSMDVSRVPHLRGRAWISFPVQEYAGRLAAYAYSSL
jgi:asparagine synthase (glutamine-hydrolysing)